MTAPFRDELGAALEHAQQLEEENEELRARVDATPAPADESTALAKLRRELEDLRKENTDLLARNMELTQKLAHPRLGVSSITFVKACFVFLIVGLLLGGFFIHR